MAPRDRGLLYGLACLSLIVLMGAIGSNVQEHGADPKGVRDSSAAFNAAIAVALGSADPATTVRYAKSAVTVPAGTYRLTSPVRARSAVGLRIVGAGRYLTRLVADGDLDTVLDLDGVAYSTVEGFTVVGPGEGATADRLITLRWGPDTVRSVTAVVVRDVVCSGGNFRTAFAVQGSNQVDHVTFRDCEAHGGGSDDPDRWQYGWEIGDGTPANVLGVHLDSCTGYAFGAGVAYLGTSGTVRGGFLQSNGADIHRGAPNSLVAISGVRSEGSARFLTTDGPTGAPGQLSVRDCDYNGNRIAPDGVIIDYQHAGLLVIDNFRIGPAIAGVIPRIRVVGARPTRALIGGLTVEGGYSPMQVLEAVGSARIEARGYVTVGADGAVLGVEDAVVGPGGIVR